MGPRLLIAMSAVLAFSVFFVCSSPVSSDGSGQQKGGATADTKGSNLDMTKGTAMRVLWTVSGYVSGRNSSLNEDRAKALLFKPLDITDTEIIFDGRRCRISGSKQEWEDAETYLSGRWKIAPKELGISDTSIRVVRTDCDLPGFREYILLRDRRLVVQIEGTFFFFDPALN